MCCTRLAEIQDGKSRQNSPSGHHRTRLSGCIFATEATDNRKKLVKQQYLPTCPYNMVNFSPLAAEIGLPVWGTPANFNGFRVMSSLLQRRRSTEANRTLYDVWPSPGLVHYIYIFGGSGGLAPNGILQGAKFTLRPSRAFSYIDSVTAHHSSSGRQPNLAALSIGRHLYSAGRPCHDVEYRPTF